MNQEFWFTKFPRLALKYADEFLANYPSFLFRVRDTFQRSKKLLGGMLKNLDAKERNVLVLRYGLEGDEARTLKQVGDIIGLSRERVRQIETQAFKKLKHHTKGKQLMWYLN